MEQYFSKDYTQGAFELFGAGHIAILFIILLFNLSFIFMRKTGERFRRRFRIALAVTAILAELSWQTWKFCIGEWTVQEMLPLHLCSVTFILGVIMMFNKNYLLFEICYFLGIAGPLQSILTPDLGPYGLPHFLAFQTLIGHGVVMSMPIWMAVVEKYRPTWKSIGRVLLLGNLYMLVIFFLNLTLGSNYMFLVHKPAGPSLLDYFGPWPIYILSMEGAALAMMLVLYLPFAVIDFRKKRVAQPK
jgi:hypothetical integral membrane protein (TIGR02206 family)